MAVRWKRLFMNLICWLASELLLGSMGIDELVDYSEYLGLLELSRTAFTVETTVTLFHNPYL